MRQKILKTLEVSGNPHQTGFAIGNEMADSIHAKILGLPEFREVEKAWKNSRYLQELDTAARNIYPQYVLELEGMAKGAQVDYDTLFLWNCRGDLPLPSGANPEHPENTPEGCTTLLLPSSGGRSAIIAHNEDGPPELNGHCRWLTVHPENGLEFSTFHYPGMLPGHTFSVNESGLVQTINNIRVADLKPGIPRHFICRAILDCASLGETLLPLRRKDRASGFHHSLGHPSAKHLLSVEAPASACVVKKIETATSHANHLLADEFSGLAQTVTESSSFRQQMSEKLLAKSTLPDAQSVLFYQSSSGQSIFRRPNDGDDDYAFTLATGIFEISEKKVSWKIYQNRNENPSLNTGTTGAN